MSLWLQRFLRRHSLAQHFWYSLAIGFFCRSLAAFFVYGPQALDDYKHGVWPAYQMFVGQAVDLPDYRSHLLNWILVGLLKIGSIFGVESALAQVRLMYSGLGVVEFARNCWRIYLRELFSIADFWRTHNVSVGDLSGHAFCEYAGVR